MIANILRSIKQANRRLPKVARAAYLTIVAALLVVITVQAVTVLSIGGYLGHSYGDAISGEPTDGRPESKLWWNDGLWWGVLYNPDMEEYQIYRLDWSTQTWTSTGTPVDDRKDSRADVLWDADSQKLYIASHVKIENPSRVTGSDNWAQLYRYSYNAGNKTYALDFGFNNLIINEDKTRTVVLDKDSNDRLWITYVSRAINSSTYQVYMNYTDGGDTNWQIPFTLPFPGATVDQIALSSVIAFTDNEGSKIGVLWSNEIDDKFYFATHLDSEDPQSGWVLETSLDVPYPANDHINFAQTSSGQLFVAVKTFATDPTDPIILLLARDLDGTWSLHPISPVDSNDSRPIVLVNEGSNTSGDEMVHVFVSANPTGGAICYYSAPIISPIEDISFIQRSCGDPGLAGASQILADTIKYTQINNATSTKQTLNSTTQTVILASDDLNGKVYTHAVLGDPPPHLTSQLPEDGTTVPTSRPAIRAVFSEDMDEDTINASSFTLQGPQGPVPSHVVYTPANRTATLTPDAPLVDGKMYTATLTNAIKDQSGQVLLNAPVTWSFQVSINLNLYLPFIGK